MDKIRLSLAEEAWYQSVLGWYDQGPFQVFRSWWIAYGTLILEQQLH